MPASLIAALATLAIVLVIAGAFLPGTQRNAIDRRLAAFAARPRSLEQLELQAPFGQRVLRPFIRQLAEAVGRVQRRRSGRAKGAEPSGGGVPLKLALAGHPYGWTPADYLGMKVFGGCAAGGVLFVLITLAGQAGFALALATLGAMVGWFAPDLLLRSKTRSRQGAIQRALPDALDLLVISVEAGLGFDAALQRLVDNNDDPLTAEFARVLAEMRVGRPRQQALKDLIGRAQVPDLSNFVGAVLQGEQLGVSITRVLTVQADQMRTLRRQRAEEKAAQLQLKLMFPLALFIFPALCIVILGPIWPTISATSGPGI